MIVALHLHGYNVEDYRQTSGKLDTAFDDRGIKSRVIVYHADTARETRQKNPDVAKRLAEAISDYQSEGHKVIVTAHSNGNTILRMAWDEYEVAPEVAVCIQPALPSDMNPCPGADAIRVYWNPDDGVVKLGRMLTWITKWISPEWALKRNWGPQGSTGYTGSDKNIENINTMHCPIKARGHSGIFHGLPSRVHLPLIAEWAATVAKKVTI